jgi:hypothetical protein
MAENMGIENIQYDELLDEALDSRDGSKFTNPCIGGSLIDRS